MLTINLLYIMLFFFFRYVFDFFVVLLCMLVGEFRFHPKLLSFGPNMIIVFSLIMFNNHLLVPGGLYLIYELYTLKEFKIIPKFI